MTGPSDDLVTIRRSDLVMLVDGFLAIDGGHQGYDVPTREEAIAELTASVPQRATNACSCDCLDCYGAHTP